MKVNQDARREVDEWREEESALKADAAADADEVAYTSMQTFKHDYQRDKDDLLSEISNQANCEGWTADSWRDALLRTYMFSEEELAQEYFRRQTDDMLGDPYGDTLYLEQYDEAMSRIHALD